MIQKRYISVCKCSLYYKQQKYFCVGTLLFYNKKKTVRIKYTMLLFATVIIYLLGWYSFKTFSRELDSAGTQIFLFCYIDPFV